ncbi:hypothetical protein [Phenylobacterium sp.]|uniref:hypothetical protein n=1 Tax=Phenylobacterium sp. TaxID=1871053 RepID=UPI0028123EBE|nr:hypothetical protein [Phenylobacterium sp.]
MNLYALPVLIHVAAGCVAIVAGFWALSVRKGGTAHGRAGTVFFVSMLVMAGFAAVMAATGQQRLNTIAAVFTLYLVGTAWAVVRRPAGPLGPWERWATLAPVALIAAGLTFGAQAASPEGLQDGDPTSGNGATIYYVFATLAAIAVASDLSVAARGGLMGYARLRRHIWRMCLALFVAAGSFFLGQQDEFPQAVQGSPLLMIPPFAALGALAWWMAVSRPTRRRAAA